MEIIGCPGGGGHDGETHHHDAITRRYPDISFRFLQDSIDLAANDASGGEGEQIYTFDFSVCQNTEKCVL